MPKARPPVAGRTTLLFRLLRRCRSQARARDRNQRRYTACRPRAFSVIRARDNDVTQFDVLIRSRFLPVCICNLRPDVSGIGIVLMQDTLEAGSVVRIAFAGVLPTLRVGAQWPLELDATRSNVVHVVGGDDFVRGDTLLYPTLQRLQ